MGLLSGLWNAATWVWNQLQNVAPGFTEAVANTVTNIVDTIVDAVQNTGSQSNTPAQPTGPTPEEIRQQRINRRANQFDRDIGRSLHPDLEEDARFYDEYPSDNILNSPASMADMILLAGQNPVVYGLMQMMKHERQTLNIVMQNAKSTVDGLRLLFADAIHYEDLAVEAAKVWDQCVGGSSTSWQPGMSSVGFDFVVSNSDRMFPSQEEPTPTPLQGPLGPNGEYFFSNEQSEIEPGSYSINTQLGTLVFTPTGWLDVLNSAEVLAAMGLSIEDLPPRIPVFNPEISMKLESAGRPRRSDWRTQSSSPYLLTEFSGNETDNAFQLRFALPQPYSSREIRQDAWMVLIDSLDQSGNPNIHVWSNLEAEIARSQRIYLDSPDSLYIEEPAAMFTYNRESVINPQNHPPSIGSVTMGESRRFNQQPQWGTTDLPGLLPVNALVIVSTLLSPVAEVDSYNRGNMGFVNQPLGFESDGPKQWGTHGETNPSAIETFMASPTNDVTYDVLLNLHLQSRSIGSESPMELVADPGIRYGGNEYRVVITSEQYAIVAGYAPSSPFQQLYLIRSYLAIEDSGFTFQGMFAEPVNTPEGE